MSAMSADLNLPTTCVDALVERIFASRRITKADQSQMMAALLSQRSISEKEQVQINRVFEALRSGLLRVVD